MSKPHTLPRLEELRQHLRGIVGGARKRIALPEAGLDGRVLQAAAMLREDEWVEPVLVGDRRAIHELGESCGFDVGQTEIIDFAGPATTPQVDHAPTGGTQAATSTRVAAATPIIQHAAKLIAAGKVDGVVAGAVATTGTVMRAAIRGVGRGRGVKTASSLFAMITNRAEFGDRGMVVFADCAMNIRPTVEQLVNIAIGTHELNRHLFGIESRIAFLSFSTHGSATDETVDKMREASEALRRVRPDLLVEGETQADAALIPQIADWKSPGSVLRGTANTLIFPDLDSANISYKLVERLGGAKAFGPIAQGFARPINDLSRGCSVEDIADVALATAAQAALA